MPKDSIVLSTAMPHEPAYRASASKTYDPHYSNANRHIDIKAKPTDHGRSTTWKEGRAWSKWKALRLKKGLPTWTPLTDDFASLRAANPQNEDLEEGDDTHEIEQAGLLEWCQAFCQSHRPMKEFVLRKEVWGWDQEGIVLGESARSLSITIIIDGVAWFAAVRAAIESTGYSHSFSVDFETTARKVMVHPDNMLSRLTTKVCFAGSEQAFLPFPDSLPLSYSPGSSFFCGSHYFIQSYGLSTLAGIHFLLIDDIKPDTTFTVSTSLIQADTTWSQPAVSDSAPCM